MARAKGTVPNILFIMMDTQGARNMSCYGYRKKTTPCIDDFAKDAVLFENHFVTSPWTLPVHASFFTGRYESGHGAGAQHEGLEPGLPSFPDILSRNGYKTVAFCNNNWAVASDRWNPGHGFQEHIRFNQVPQVAPYVDSDNPEEVNSKKGLHAVSAVNQWLIKNKRSRKPFCMYINLLEPHDQYRPAEPWRSKFLPDWFTYEEAVRRSGDQLNSTCGAKRHTFEEWEMQRALYDGETATCDDRVGMLLDIFQKSGLYDDTLIVIFGDHGDD
ncbi:sulfatase, partial [Candidatus Hydrogenedentota bacterium]